MSDCQRGCLLYALHTPDCGCTHECPQHDHHCEGCLPRPAEVGGYCQRCAFQLRDTIDDIATLTSQVTQLPDGRLAPPDRAPGDDLTRQSTRVDHPSPSPAYDASEEGARWLHAWALAVADELAERGPFDYRRDGTHEPNPTTEARYLTSRIAHITAQPYANDLTNEARQLAHNLTRAAAADPGDQRIPTRCPSCNQRTLVRPNGAEHVECRNKRCSTRWYSDAYGMLARMTAS